MTLYQRVLKAVREQRPARDIEECLGIPPSKLRRVLHGRRFLRQMELEREVAELSTRLQVQAYSPWLVKVLDELANNPRRPDAVKACLTLLNHAFGGSILAPARAASPPALALEARPTLPAQPNAALLPSELQMIVVKAIGMLLGSTGAPPVSSQVQAARQTPGAASLPTDDGGQGRAPAARLTAPRDYLAANAAATASGLPEPTEIDKKAAGNRRNRAVSGRTGQGPGRGKRRK